MTGASGTQATTLPGPGTQQPNPYVGPRAFEQGERQYFFGRDEEIAIVEGLVMARRASLLFAQSGAGKSSLLRAGLIPELVQQRTVGRGPRPRVYQKMRVLPIASVGRGSVAGAAMAPGPTSAVNVYVSSTLLSLRPELRPEDVASTTLAEGLATLLTSDANEADGGPAGILLIFDQFEELFTSLVEHRPEREGFFHQVNDLLSAYPDLHVLFSMREDYIAELTPYASILPEELRPRYRLERLNRDAALKAVTMPAAAAGRTFAPGVAEALVDNLRRAQPAHRPPLAGTEVGGNGGNGSSAREMLGDYVEPVHLQIVCRQLWASLDGDKQVIQPEDVQAFGNVDEALTGFYEGTVRKAVDESGVSERRLRAWFGEHLITAARTRGLAYRGETETEGLPNDAIDVLNDAYVIRAVIRGGEAWYELAHDRLVEPVLKSNAAWLAAYRNPLAGPGADWVKDGRGERLLLRGEALAEARRFAAANAGDLTQDETDFLNESVRQARLAQQRRRRTMTAAVVIAVALIGLTTWALLNAREASRQARQSRSRELAAAALANLNGDPEASILLALQGLEIDYTSEAEDALHRALQASRVERNLAGHTEAVHDVAYSPDGRWMATASADGTAKVWDAITGRAVLTLSGHQGMVYAVAYKPDGSQVATAGYEDGTVRTWDTVSGEPVLLLQDAQAHSGPVLNLAFSPDGSRLASAAHDGHTAIWNAESGLLERTLTGHTDEVLSVAWSPDGERIATGGRDGKAIIWDASSGAPVLTLTGHTDAVTDAAFSPDGKLVATGSWDQTSRLWDAHSGGEVLRLSGHAGWVRGVAFNADGSRLATTSWDRRAKVWDVRSGRELMSLPGHRGWLMGVAFSPDGAHLATAGEDNVAKIWNVGPSGETIAMSPHRGARVNALAVSPDGLLLATAGDDGSARIWDTVSGKQVSTFKTNDLPVRALAMAASCNEEMGNDKPGSPGGCPLILATGGNDRNAYVWNLADEARPTAIYSDTVPVTGVALSLQCSGQPGPAGRCLLRLGTSDSASLARIWDIGASDTPVDLTGHERRVNNIAFSPDGKLAATSAADDTAKIWDASSGQLLRTLQGHVGEVYYVAFSADGKRVATAGIDQTIKIWETTSGEELMTLRGHRDRVTSVAFSPDGNRVASASWDQTVKLWDLRDGRSVLTLVGHDGKVLSVAFGPEGSRLYSAGEDGTVRFYVLQIDELRRAALARVTRTLRPEECAQYRLEDRCGEAAPAVTGDRP